ncbi:hypothetical protein [Leucobacter denitrificans]|uniref:DUF4853 domain-containing protein n=1 Tax=Leucobacter denitrificans TaxID=683042 RepID=A0A7G9S448_9MICO|nr:hypothetical protein [Leucobacter denitrificans]QNN62623.1 hypothetical protein H9L06_10360 [Leucobacter denitrificans]
MKREYGRAVFRAAVIVSVLVITIGLAACAEEVEVKMGVTDAGRLTRGEVEEMSLHEQFDLFGERRARAEQLITDVQLQVSSGEWFWGSGLTLPHTGSTARNGLPGANGENSYHFSIARMIQPQGAVGARDDIDPVVSYFKSQGWEVSFNEVRENFYEALADTGDGYVLEYVVRPTGNYSLEVSSYLFWGDYKGLLHAIADRVPDEKLGIKKSLPGIFIPFPEWSDPVVEYDPFADL